MKRTNFPGRKDEKRKSAAERQKLSQTLTLKERLARLDQKLGVEMGAKKERAKLLKKMAEKELKS